VIRIKDRRDKEEGGLCGVSVDYREL